MAEPLRHEQVNELLRDARRHFTSVPTEPEVGAAPTADAGGPVRMYRGQPIAEPAGGRRRPRTYRGAPIAEGRPAARPGRAAGVGTSMVDKLRQLQDLRESGVIDAAEFDRLKRALLEE